MVYGALETGMEGAQPALPALAFEHSHDPRRLEIGDDTMTKRQLATQTLENQLTRTLFDVEKDALMD